MCLLILSSKKIVPNIKRGNRPPIHFSEGASGGTSGLRIQNTVHDDKQEDATFDDIPENTVT